MKIQKFLLGFLLTVLLVSECVGQQPSTGQSPSANDVLLIIAAGGAKKALAELETKAAEAEKSGEWALAAGSYNAASRLARITGELQKALSYASKGFELGGRTKDPMLQVAAIRYLAWVYWDLKQYDAAREWTEKGIEITKQLQPGGAKAGYEGVLYRTLGQDYLRRGKIKEAIASLSHSLQVLESQLSNYAKIRGKLKPGVFDNAVQLLASTLNQLAQAHEKAGNIDEAIRSSQRGVDLVKQFQVKTANESSLYEGLGRLYLAKKEFNRAQENFQRALEFAETRQAGLQAIAARVGIGDVLRATGKPAEALPYYQTAIQQTENTRSELQSQEFRESFFEGGLSPYSKVIDVLLAVGRENDAFNYSERARSRSFLDILGNKVQLARNSTLMEHERALQARISVLRAMMEGDGTDSEQAPQLRKDLDEAQKDYNDYLTKLRKENKEQASLMNVEPLTITQVQERLDPGVTMLEYFVTSSSVYLWVVEKDRVQFVSTSIPRTELVSKVTSLRDTIYQLGEKERFSALSQELHKLLIQPALPHIRGKELVIVPHDVLHYLPFQALLGTDSRYLIEKYPIYYLSSASLMQFTQEKRRAMGEKVLAFGNPDLDDSKMALQFAEIEAGEIKKLYPQSTVLLKKEATEQKAKSLSPQNDIVHFASHAELNEDDPLGSAILLAKDGKEDGRLEVREIFGMDLKASLVVLSACETGLGKLSSGDELVGLTRAFIYAGTPSVVASLWNVEDSSTAQLMASFYKNLKTMTKVEALRQAQLNLIRGNVNSDLLARRGIGGIGKLGEVPAAKNLSPDSVSISTAHPFFWAPFILVGEGK